MEMKHKMLCVHEKKRVTIYTLLVLLLLFPIIHEAQSRSAPAFFNTLAAHGNEVYMQAT